MNDDTLPLLPCPFCGHDTPEFERMGSPKQSCIVICGMCGCRHESSDENERNGESWNTRVQACAGASKAWRDTVDDGLPAAALRPDAEEDAEGSQA